MYSADYFHPTIAAAAGSTCAIAASGESPGRVYCWGLNNHGQLGDGTTVNKTTPVPIASNLDFWMLSARYGHACAIKDSGGVLYCWGRNTYGQLGIGTTTDRNVPTRVGLPPQ
jgi:alpha-tubulin suppressor-like RCC1 family protein